MLLTFLPLVLFLTTGKAASLEATTGSTLASAGQQSLSGPFGVLGPNAPFGSVLAIDIPNPALGSDTPLTWCWGFRFSVNAPVTVSEVCQFDFNQDGLPAAFTVTIWTRPGQVQVLQGTVQAGTASQLDGVWRCEPITPVLLATGTYSMCSTNTASIQYNTRAYLAPGDVVVHPDITYLGAIANGVSYVVSYPATDRPDANVGVFGPSFLTTPLAGPSE